MPSIRIIVDALADEDADFNDPQGVRRTVETTADEVEPFGPVDVDAGATKTLPFGATTGVNRMAVLIVAVRGRGTIRLTRGDATTADLDFDTGTLAPGDTERVYVIPANPTTGISPWAAGNIVTGIAIIGLAAGGGARVRGWYAGT